MVSLMFRHFLDGEIMKDFKVERLFNNCDIITSNQSFYCMGHGHYGIPRCSTATFMINPASWDL